VVMLAPNFDQRCKGCNSFIIFDPSVREQNGKCVPLDLNHKRHFCSSSSRTVHECCTIDRLQKEVEDANNNDLVSFRVELKIVDE